MQKSITKAVWRSLNELQGHDKYGWRCEDGFFNYARVKSAPFKEIEFTTLQEVYECVDLIASDYKIKLLKGKSGIIIQIE